MVCKTFIIQFLFFCLDLHLFCSYWFSNFQIIGFYRVTKKSVSELWTPCTSDTQTMCENFLFKERKFRTFILCFLISFFGLLGGYQFPFFGPIWHQKRQFARRYFFVFQLCRGIQKMTPLTIFWERKKGLTRVRDLDKSGLFSETDPYKKFSPFM